MLDDLNIASFDHVIFLCYSDHLGEQEADSTTLMTLLHLRDIAKKVDKDFSITSEMLDVRNRALAEITEADDFIVSDNLISLMLSQVAENKSLNAILEDIFDPEGSEIYLKPASDYVRLGQTVNFYTVVNRLASVGKLPSATAFWPRPKMPKRPMVWWLTPINRMRLSLAKKIKL